MLTQHGIPYTQPAGQWCLGWCPARLGTCHLRGIAFLLPLGVLAETYISEHLGPKTPTDPTAEHLRGDPGLRANNL